MIFRTPALLSYALNLTLCRYENRIFRITPTTITVDPGTDQAHTFRRVSRYENDNRNLRELLICPSCRQPRESFTERTLDPPTTTTTLPTPLWWCTQCAPASIRAHRRHPATHDHYGLDPLTLAPITPELAPHNIRTALSRILRRERARFRRLTSAKRKA